MDLETACKILEFDMNDLHNITTEQLKKKYHSLALKHHPDKNSNRPGTTFYFQQIQESYEYLSTQIKNGSFVSIEERESNYIDLVAVFISGIVKGISKESLTNIMENILSGWKSISLQLFDELDKEKAFEIYSFICKYKHILYINDSIIKQVEKILLNKFKNDNVFILNPRLHDLLENNIYKLDIDNELYFVPLWHNELYFDNNIIAVCIPELDKNISIDDDNNISVELYISWDYIKKEKNIYFTLGNNEYIIPIDKLFIKTVQIYTLKNQGISQIDENDIYNTSKKGDVYVKIQLVDE